MKNFRIENLRSENDLDSLAEIYVDLYSNSVLKEKWTKVQPLLKNHFSAKSLGKELYKEHFNLAIRKYDAKFMEAHTYFDDNRYPLKWYEKLGFEIIDDWKIISGELNTVLKNL